MAPEFLTKRLRLRKWRKEDLDLFAAMNADPRVMEFFPKILDRTESDILAERIRTRLDQHAYGLWAVEVLGEAPFIGFVGLSEPDFEASFTPCIEIGWRLAHQCWGHGYVTEAAARVIEYAFRELALAELVSFTAALNVRSQKVMQRLGMSSKSLEEFRHPSLLDGHPLQTHVLYRLNRDTWYRQQNA